MTFGALAAIGAGAGLTGLVGAQGVTTTASTQPTAAVSAPADARQMDHSKGGHIGSNGTKETLLTGDTASKVTAAALAAVPGGTIERVENDAEGAAYEAHMTKADGTHVTVKFDSNFAVTATETGHGR
ncbi:MAG: hypothetical protein JWN89_646 [Parcubacteria group bacterium]|nr:hypothetical protein [Parcubacteria group bacterium]